MWTYAPQHSTPEFSLNPRIWKRSSPDLHDMYFDNNLRLMKMMNLLYTTYNSLLWNVVL